VLGRIKVTCVLEVKKKMELQDSSTLSPTNSANSTPLSKFSRARTPRQLNELSPTNSANSTPLSKFSRARTPRQLNELSPYSLHDPGKSTDDLDTEFSLRNSSSPSTVRRARQASFPSIFPEMDKVTMGALGRFYESENECLRQAPAAPNEKTINRRKSGVFSKQYWKKSGWSTKSAQQEFKAASLPGDISEDRDRIRTTPLPELNTDVEVNVSRRKSSKANPSFQIPLKNKIFDVKEDLPSPSKPESYDRRQERKFKKRRKLRKIRTLRTPGSKAKELLGIGGKIPRERSGGGKLYLNSIFHGAFGGSDSKDRKILDDLKSRPLEPTSVIIDENLASHNPQSDVSSLVTDDVTNEDDKDGSGLSIVTLNVGGQKYQTTKVTLKKHPRFFKGLNSNEFGTQLEESGSYFIDRDPVLFVHIMRYLRDSAIRQDLNDITLYKQLEREAKYFCLNNMVLKIKALIKQLERNADDNLVEYQQRLVMFVREDKLDLTWSNWVLNWGYNFVNWVEASNPKNSEPLKKGAGRMAILLQNRAENKKDKDWKYYHLVFQKKLSNAQMKVLQRIDTM